MQQKGSRFALCLYGNFNNRYSEKSGESGFKFIKKHLIDKYDFDIFLFSTDVKNESRIKLLYGKHGATFEFEPQKNWSEFLIEREIDAKSFRPQETFRTLENTCNFLYTRSKSINLAINHARTRGFSYEWLIACRFDLGQIDKYNGYHPFKVSEIGFNPELDRQYIYGALWNQNNLAVADQWFYGNQDNMGELANMFPDCIEYFKPESTYLRMLEKGVPLSSAEDEFSNECFRPAKIHKPELTKIPMERALNNHLVQRHFMYEKGLFGKLRGTSLMPNVARVVYTHTDYSDCWPLFFGQLIKYGNIFQKNYVFLNKHDGRIPSFFTQVVYNENDMYTDRLLTCLRQVKERVLFFEHEDMILTGVPEVTQLQRYSGLIKKFWFQSIQPNRFDAIKLINGGKYQSIPVRVKGVFNLRKILRGSEWIFSIQPSFWSRSSFEALLRRHRKTGIWDFELNAQKSMQSLRFRTALVVEDTKLRGNSHFDSGIYPFIATAIVKGRWNLSEYPEEIAELAREYQTNLNLRGTT